MTRDQNRSARKREVRPKTIAQKQMSKRSLAVGRELYPVTDHGRPTTRPACGSARPCPFVSCQHHLYLDVDLDNGSIKLNFPDLEVWEMSETCALDVADRGGTRLEDVGAIINLTRERVRQIEVKALDKIEALGTLRDYAPERA